MDDCEDKTPPKVARKDKGKGKSKTNGKAKLANHLMTSPTQLE